MTPTPSANPSMPGHQQKVAKALNQAVHLVVLGRLDERADEVPWHTRAEFHSPASLAGEDWPRASMLAGAAQDGHAEPRLRRKSLCHACESEFR